MSYWEFNKADPSDVFSDPNQGDQFSNDDVGLSEALVREVIQNSSDAENGAGPVKIRFQIVDLVEEDVTRLSSLLEPLNPHLEAAQFSPLPSMPSSIRTLVIEDFNTTGLTGRFDIRDKDNFTNFWRNLARSAKSGKDGGRWGLGKLVFSSSSKAKSFWGLTRRRGDKDGALMAQAVLKHHEIDGEMWKPHGFWFDGRSEGEKLQLPVTSPQEVESFSKMAHFKRSDQTGLSLFIPYLVDGIDESAILSGVVKNYYFPILSGKLEVEVGGRAINATTFLEIAEGIENTGVPFSFVREVSTRTDDAADFISEKNVGKFELDESFFTQEEWNAIRSKYNAGLLIKVRVPVLLRPKNEGELESHMDLYLQKMPEGVQPFALYSRGPIILPAERRNFSGASAWGALVADAPDLAAFLGDAENPAHTRWNPQAEKVKSNWRMPYETLRSIRHSLKNLYVQVADLEEVEDTDALADIFSITKPEQPKRGKKPSTPTPKPEIEPKQKAISILERKGGFSIVSGPGAQGWTFPRLIRARVAYDMIGADPFKRHSPFDFNLGDASEIEVAVTGGEIAKRHKSNVIFIKVEDPNFRVDFDGFDENRDIVAEARLVEQKS